MMELLSLSVMENVSITRCCLFINGRQKYETAYHCPNHRARRTCKILCSSSREKRGFGPQSTKKEKTIKSKGPRKDVDLESPSRKPVSKASSVTPNEAPTIISDRNPSNKGKNIVVDNEFEERLEAVRRSAVKQKKVEESTEYGPINYDAPTEPAKNGVGFGTKVGIGVAVVVFGFVFALGDFLPSVSVTSNDESATVSENKLTKEEKAILQTRLVEYEDTLTRSPKDLNALEGAAVVLSELGEYSQAASLLERLAMENPRDPDTYRLLGEVKYELKDYEGSAAAYRSSASVSEHINFEVLRGLTNTLLAAKKPGEAVQVLLASREQIDAENSKVRDPQSTSSSSVENEAQKVDPIQVELLLGKAYSDWGHVSDAVSVYDQLISKYPDDFRGYLAKGIIYKQNGKSGDAERMFIQARFFAPEKAKLFVDSYARQ